jgi:hypothetical protein
MNFLADRSAQSPKTVGSIAREILTPMFKAHDHLRLMMDWSAIVGDHLAGMTWPQKTIAATKGQILYLKVTSQHVMEVWGSSPVILERVNQYLGWSAVERVRLLTDRGR